MFSEITTTRDIATAVWNMGVLESIISGAQGAIELANAKKFFTNWAK